MNQIIRHQTQEVVKTKKNMKKLIILTLIMFWAFANVKAQNNYFITSVADVRVSETGSGILTNQKRIIAENLTRLSEAQQKRRRAKEQKLQEQFEAEQHASANELAEQNELDRQSQVHASRETVVQFYLEHEECLRQALPRALFLTRLRNKFPNGISPAQADIVVEELILGFLPLIEEGNTHAVSAMIIWGI